MRQTMLWCCLVMLIALGTAWGDVRLPHLFSDNMVLQRERPIAVWGWADAGEVVTVTLGTATAKATANALGEWSVQLPALKEGEGLTLTVAARNTLVLKNLIMGDVWICSGQSNMEMMVSGCNCPDDIKAADFPKIRRLKIDHIPSANPEHDFPRTAWTGLWVPCAPPTVTAFTAAGFFFARDIFQRTGVPIGLIDVSWGGTPIEPWYAPAGLAGIPEMAQWQKEYDTAMTEYHARLPKELDRMEAWLKAARAAQAANQEIPTPPTPPAPALWTPGDGPRDFTLFNGMINPLVRFPIKGALWYQGESNGGDSDIYYHKMRALIGGWRAMWKQGDFPFYYVQLASYVAPTDNPAGGDGWANIRNAQTKALAISHTGIATAVDIGDAANIHPTDKLDVGLRLARWALYNDYGMKDLVPGGPIFKEMKVEGNAIRLSFDYIGSGLMIGKKTGPAPTVEDKDGKLTRFAIAGADKQWVWADAVIDGNTVVVSSAKVPEPVAVRYAYSCNPAGANLYNKEGLPALPFRTDNW